MDMVVNFLLGQGQAPFMDLILACVERNHDMLQSADGVGHDFDSIEDAQKAIKGCLVSQSRQQGW